MILGVAFSIGVNASEHADIPEESAAPVKFQEAPQNPIQVDLYAKEIKRRLESLGFKVQNLQLKPLEIQGSLAHLRSTVRQSVKEVIVGQQAQYDTSVEWQFILSGGIMIDKVSGWIPCYAYVNVNYHDQTEINAILLSFRHLILDQTPIWNNKAIAASVKDKLESILPATVQRIEVRDPDWTKSPYATVNWGFDRFIHFRDYLMAMTANKYPDRTFRKLGSVDLEMADGHVRVVDIEMRVIQSDEDANTSKAITLMLNLESMTEPKHIKRIDD